MLVPASRTLTFSYVGYLAQTVAAANGMKVTLEEDNKVLNEVVVVGYGTMRRKDVTSSITTVKSEDLNKGVFSDPASMLQGKVAGLTVTTNGDPTGGGTITLRGASSLRSGTLFNCKCKVTVEIGHYTIVGSCLQNAYENQRLTCYVQYST